MKKNALIGKKVAIALSGGPDSMALFQALLKIQKPDLILHVNHQMRKESDEEAVILSELAYQNGIEVRVFHNQGFDFTKGNIEDRLRSIRYQFFEQALKASQIQHLFLGHQKQDAEETILKRILEGASLFKMGAILNQKIASFGFIHRPFIQLSKNDLIQYLNEKKRSYFEDQSNQDEKFLRARFRKIAFPALERSLEKKIEGKFINLALEADAVFAYFNKKLEPVLKTVLKGPLGLFFPFCILEELEFKICLQILLSQLNWTFSKDALASLIQCYLNKQFGKKIITQKQAIFFEKSGLFFVKKEDFESTIQPRLKMNNKRIWCEVWVDLNVQNPQQVDNQ